MKGDIKIKSLRCIVRLSLYINKILRFINEENQ